MATVGVVRRQRVKIVLLGLAWEQARNVKLCFCNTNLNQNSDIRIWIRNIKFHPKFSWCFFTYSWRNTLARSRNRWCCANATVPSLCMLGCMQLFTLSQYGVLHTNTFMANLRGQEKLICIMSYIPSVHNGISVQWYNIDNYNCIYFVTVLRYFCVLTVYNTLYKFVNTQRDGLCQKINKFMCIHVKCPIFLPDFNQICNFCTDTCPEKSWYFVGITR